MIAENVLKPALVVLGTLFLAVGVVGIFVPLLPTTPFLLLASACYLRSSKRMHDWLLSHGKLGGYIRDFEEGRGIPLRAKLIAFLMMWTSIGYGAWKVASGWGSAALIAVGAGVTIYLLKLPTLRR